MWRGDSDGWRLRHLWYMAATETGLPESCSQCLLRSHLQLHMPGPPGQIRGKEEHKWLEGEPSPRLLLSLAVVWKRGGSPTKALQG